MGLGGLALILLVTSTITIVKAGHVGVVDLFGRVSTYTLKSGLQIVNPLARVIQMSVQTLEIKERMEVPSKEGMTMVIEVSVLYHLDPEKAADVYRTVGEDFVGVILEPQFRSITRGVTASYEAKALYTSEREAVAKLILDDLKQLVGPRGIVVEATPMRQLTLPAKITAAIEDKLSADQESQRMTFVLTKEKQEAERKRIEAQGVADFPENRHRRHQRQAAAVEGHRGHAGSGQEPEREDRDHRQLEERIATGSGRCEVESQGSDPWREVESNHAHTRCVQSGDGCGRVRRSAAGGAATGADVHTHADCGHAGANHREVAREARDRLPARLGVHRRPASAQGRREHGRQRDEERHRAAGVPSGATRHVRPERRQGAFSAREERAGAVEGPARH
jgi:regulator of protease activity HflC (stomatin/prohibitin superfamily)